jgi:hypothetical protein
MSESASVHEEIFLFVLGNDGDPADDGYAKVTGAFKRKSPGNRAEAWAEIEQGKTKTSWGIAASTHCPGGIDMAFGTAQPCLVFVAISGPQSHAKEASKDDIAGPLHDLTTYFGDQIVTPLAIRGIPKTSIITHAELHQLPGIKYPTVCSFVLDRKSAMTELGSSNDAGTLARFPIVFDFVDSDDGISPVFKKPSRSKRSASPKTDLTMFGHGGIHPPNGASMIEFF